MTFSTTLLDYYEDGRSKFLFIIDKYYQSIRLRKNHLSQFKNLKKKTRCKGTDQYPVFTQINIIFEHIEEAGNFRVKILPKLSK